MLSLLGHVWSAVWDFALTIFTGALAWACGMGLAYFIGTLLGIDYSKASDNHKKAGPLPGTSINNGNTAEHLLPTAEASPDLHQSLETQRDIARRRAQKLHRRAQTAEARVIELEKELRKLKEAQDLSAASQHIME